MGKLRVFEHDFFKVTAKPESKVKHASLFFKQALEFSVFMPNSPVQMYQGIRDEQRKYQAPSSQQQHALVFLLWIVYWRRLFCLTDLNYTDNLQKHLISALEYSMFVLNSTAQQRCGIQNVHRTFQLLLFSFTSALFRCAAYLSGSVKQFAASLTLIGLIVHLFDVL